MSNRKPLNTNIYRPFCLLFVQSMPSPLCITPAVYAPNRPPECPPAMLDSSCLPITCTYDAINFFYYVCGCRITLGEAIMKLCRALRLPVFYATAGWAVLVLTVRLVILGCQVSMSTLDRHIVYRAAAASAIGISVICCGGLRRAAPAERSHSPGQGRLR